MTKGKEGFKFITFYTIYFDQISKKYVVPNFISVGNFLILDELPNPGVEITFEDIEVQHHANDNPQKRPVTVIVF